MLIIIFLGPSLLLLFLGSPMLLRAHVNFKVLGRHQEVCFRALYRTTLEKIGIGSILYALRIGQVPERILALIKLFSRHVLSKLLARVNPLNVRATVSKVRRILLYLGFFFIG